MEISVFTDKTVIPSNDDLKNTLGDLYLWWKDLEDYVLFKYPKALKEWNYSGVKYGWNYRLKDKKRAIVYLLPREKGFKAALVFGEKATQMALNSNLSEATKKIIEDAPVYAEGRGFRIPVDSIKIIDEIKILINIKLSC